MLLDKAGAQAHPVRRSSAPKIRSRMALPAPGYRKQHATSENTMAKGQKRSGREAKKPKADKKPGVTTVSPFDRSVPPPPKKAGPKPAGG